MRLFFAINFPQELRDFLHSSTAALRMAGPGMRWVRPEKIHLTLRFIGDGDEAAARALAGVAAEVAREFQRFELELGGLGGFPNLGKPRVVWIGVEPNPKLELMRHDLELRLAALGYETEGRPFRPHVTIGRARDRTRRLPDAFRQAAESIDVRSETQVNSLDLMNSIPAEGGSYACLRSAPLGR